MRFVAAHGNGGGACGFEHGRHAANLFFHLFGRAVALAQQNGSGSQVVARVHKVFHSHRHGAVHHLEASRDDACSNDGGHRIARFAHIVKTGHDAARQLGLGHELDGDFGDHGQHAFAANQDGQQVKARRIERIGTKGDRLTRDGVALHLDDVVHREAVFEAVHAAGVFGHVAADGAGDLTRRIGRVIQAVGGGGLRNGEVAHTGLHHGGLGQWVDVKDLVELG